MSLIPAPTRRCVLIAAVVLGAALTATAGPAAPTAAAGQYTIYVCDATPPDGVPASAEDAQLGAFPETRPFTTATPKMFSTRAGRRCSAGKGVRGLVSMNYYPRGGTAPRGARARYVTRAPAGTEFARVRWAGTTQRRDCRWTAQMYTRGPGGKGTVAIRNKRGPMRDCRGEGQGRASGTTRLTTFPRAAGATRYVQQLVCAARRCSNRGVNYAKTKAMEITIADDTPPSIGILGDTPFAQGQWVGSGDHQINYDTADNVGVKAAKAFIGATEVGSGVRACDFRGLGGLVPCPNGPGAVAVDTQRVPEGSHALVLGAIDSADNVAAAGNTVTVRVDRVAPGAIPVGVAGGEGWRQANDFDAGWATPDEPDRAPIVAAHYRLCPAAGGPCVEGRRDGQTIAAINDLAVPAEGEWTLRMWRSDAAGNQLRDNASQPVALRLDSTPPQLGFEATAAADPTLLAAQVNDPVSGLAAGEIEISRVGSGSWQQIPTTVQGSRLVARVDDAKLPEGAYAARAFARDQAGNQGANDRRLDGQPMVVQVPLRIRTALRAGVAKQRTVRTVTKRVKRHGKRRTVRRRKTVLRPRVRVGFGRSVSIAGQLANSDGQPLPGAAVAVYSRTATKPEQVVSLLTTGPKGRYRYRARGTSTRTLRFAYAGTAQILPSQDEVTLLVPAASTIKINPRKTTNGRTVRFRGRLKAPIPGKLVELQARLPGRWQTFKTLRTGPSGVWKARYRFSDTCGQQRYRFRARLPKQAGYPYEAGRTRTASVTVNGRNC